jgi:hypothetical protein
MLLPFPIQLSLILTKAAKMNYLHVLIWATTSISLFICTFIFYVTIMKMREVKQRLWRLHWPVRWTCFFILFIGLILDVLLNWIACTIIFVEFPREFLTTSRVVRHKRESAGFRYKLAIYFCQHWLTPFDEQHCE